MYETNFVRARTLNDAWRETLECCARNGESYLIEGGSYVGQIRKQLPYLTILVEEPSTRPFIFYTPQGIPEPTNEEKIEKYFYEYIATDTKVESEDYTYGMYISLQLPFIIDILNITNGNSNQACITIGDPFSVVLKDPPCLRTIDFKVVNGKLNMTVYFRSWDLFAGLPENLGGLQLLKEYVIANLNFPVQDGSLIAHSSGGHIYEMYFSIIDILNANKIGDVEFDGE